MSVNEHDDDQPDSFEVIERLRSQLAAKDADLDAAKHAAAISELNYARACEVVVAKDAKIAALEGEIEQAKHVAAIAEYNYKSACDTVALQERQIVALRKSAALLAGIDCLIDENCESKGHAFDSYRDDQVVFGVGKDRVITAGDLRHARAALEMSGGVK